jgi:hypothetical protein
MHDNASPNDTMIVKLKDLIKTFPGASDQAHCFNHVVAFVAKSAVHQFDIPKGAADAALDDAEKKLRDLVDGIDIEDEEMQGQWEDNDEDSTDGEGDDGWVDEVANLPKADYEELEENIRPARLMLVKVSHCFNIRFDANGCT